MRVFDDCRAKTNPNTPSSDAMGACELCGADNRSTRQAIATSVNVEACTSCIESMGLELFESPFSKNTRGAGHDTGTPAPRSSARTPVDSTLVNDFHIKIRNERLSRGWTQKELAMKLNERQNTLQRIENGSRPTDELVGKLERILRISLQADTDVSYEQRISTKAGRGLTIADALDEFLTKGDGDG